MDGKAYVDDLSPDEIREYRGTLTKSGKESPYRDRPAEENLDLFDRMRKGEFPDGSKVLRAKIDMASPNINMRDPIMYRILHETHHRTGDKWCVYPMYDWAHGLEDSIENVTHSICTLEFEDHRPLYDWFLDQLPVNHPQQIEFARLNLNYTVMSKRKLLELVTDGHVKGWDDPRLPTISGFRRRGYTPAAIRNFCDRIGVGKSESVIDVGILEDSVREDLEHVAKRAMAVLRPIRVVITNYPEDKTEEIEAPCHPKNPDMGTRKFVFSRVIYIEKDDFMEDPPKKYFRLSPGKEVRLRNAYLVKCDEVIKDEKTGEVTELRCSYDPETMGKKPSDGRKVKGVIHWVSADHSLKAEVRLCDRLFVKENPTEDKDTDYKEYLNPHSLDVITEARLEPSLADAKVGERYQFERVGYFCLDSVDFSPNKIVFNRIVTLRDTWAKMGQG